MPTYVYQLDGSDETFEVFQRMSEEPITERDGHPVHRVPCVPRRHSDKGFTPYISNALPHTINGCPRVMQNGRPKLFIDSRKTENNMIARYELTRDAAQNED